MAAPDPNENRAPDRLPPGHESGSKGGVIGHFAGAGRFALDILGPAGNVGLLVGLLVGSGMAVSGLTAWGAGADGLRPSVLWATDLMLGGSFGAGTGVLFGITPMVLAPLVKHLRGRSSGA